MSAVKLQRGANAPLADLPAGSPLVVGFGWKVIESNGPALELVPSAIVCGESGKALSDEHLVFFNQLASPEGAVRYVDAGDEEQLEVDLAAVPPAVDKIVFVVYADPELRKPGNFGSVRAAHLRLADGAGAELVRYDVEVSSDPEVTAMIFGEVYRHRGAWKVRAVGQGYTTGMAGVARDFAVAI